MHVFYDDTFNTRFGADVMTRINAIFTIVTTIYDDPTLTTVIEPNIIQTSYQSGASWEATEPILRYVFCMFTILIYTHLFPFLHLHKLQYLQHRTS